MGHIEDHPLRYELANELHARPFPSLHAPCRAAFLAIKKAGAAETRDRKADRAHLIALLDRHGAVHPTPDATHYSGQIGRHILKWEQHTEFVTYTVFLNGLSDRPFDAADFEVFPSDWLADAPGVRLTSAIVRIEARPDEEVVSRYISEWFVPESVAVSKVVDDGAIVAGDFRIDESGHMRFAVFVTDVSKHRRAGRVVQRLCEIETYKTMSMLGLSRIRAMSDRLNEIDRSLTGLMEDMASGETEPDQTLNELLSLSAELETMIAQSSFRFAASKAYEAIVNQRIQVLREERFTGRQTIAEFMMRRYDPAMRTVKSNEGRLGAMSERAIRAGELLRTRVDVERSAQNQALLESMDRRADLQLRLQKTVEGLSVVAISYYAVSLVGYLLYPLASVIHMSKGLLTSLITLPVVLAVWMIVHRIRRKME